MNTVEAQHYEDYAKFQEYLGRKRAENAPAFGATALLAVAALGVVDSPRPRSEFAEKAVSNTFSRELGSTALISQMTSHGDLEIDFEPQAVYTGRRSDLTLAA